jgi:bacterioferritin-associated ferredoxin
MTVMALAIANLIIPAAVMGIRVISAMQGATIAAAAAMVLEAAISAAPKQPKLKLCLCRSTFRVVLRNPRAVWNCLKSGFFLLHPSVHFNISRSQRHRSASKSPSFMIVCSCNVLTDHDVRSAVNGADDLPRNAKQIYGCLGCSAECGRCARTIKKIIDEALGACAKACCSGCPHSQAHSAAPAEAPLQDVLPVTAAA